MTILVDLIFAFLLSLSIMPNPQLVLPFDGGTAFHFVTIVFTLFPLSYFYFLFCWRYHQWGDQVLWGRTGDNDTLWRTLQVGSCALTNVEAELLVKLCCKEGKVRRGPTDAPSAKAQVCSSFLINCI